MASVLQKNNHSRNCMFEITSPTHCLSCSFYCIAIYIAVLLCICIITFILANLSSRCSDASLHCHSLLRIVALLAAHNSVAVDFSCSSLSYIVAELAVVKTYHYDFLLLSSNLKLYITIYTEIYRSREVAILFAYCDCLSENQASSYLRFYLGNEL